MSEAARSRWEEASFEPQAEGGGRDALRGAAPSDPLAELARLIGQDDPYRDVFRPVPREALAEPAQRDAYHGDMHPHGDGEEIARADAVPTAAPWRHEDRHHDEGVYHAQDGYAAGHDGYAAGHDGYAEAAYPYGAADYGLDHAARHGEPALPSHPDHGAEDQAVPASLAIPDLWARGEDARDWPAPQVDHVAPDAAPTSLARSSARRPVAVLAAVLLLTAGGLAASFMAKNNGSPAILVAGTNRAAPTILAATTPAKVKVDDGSATAPEDQDAALLNKSAAVSSGPVKIVSSQEQPADLGQLAKADLADGARPLPAPLPSPFPEPKKVKTFTVHPDGSMMASDGTPVSAAPGAVAPALASSRISAVVHDAPAAALAATPATAARGGVTPTAISLAPAPTIASLSADAAPPAAAAPAPVKPVRQPPAPGPHAAAPKPVRTAAASAGPSGGSFGLQLASSPIEADADTAFAKLKRKYPDQLGALTATVHKFETGDKPIYRVRVGGMSQDEAKALCTQLQNAGGTCFVVHN